MLIFNETTSCPLPALRDSAPLQHRSVLHIFFRSVCRPLRFLSSPFPYARSSFCSVITPFHAGALRFCSVSNANRFPTRVPRLRLPSAPFPLHCDEPLSVPMRHFVRSVFFCSASPPPPSHLHPSLLVLLNAPPPSRTHSPCPLSLRYLSFLSSTCRCFLVTLRTLSPRPFFPLMSPFCACRASLFHASSSKSPIFLVFY